MIDDRAQRSTDVTGTVWAVFAHRVALQTDGGKILADLGPDFGRDGSRRLAIAEGDRVTLSGEQKPSEIKVETIVLADGSRHTIVRAQKAHDDADPEVALRSVRTQGYTVSGEPDRKPKHWNIRADRNGQAYELHVELDGHIRKVKDRSSGLAA